ncbi:HAD family hydrolase [Streptomyces meridianus]|uniref:HAD family hydrolase n=1 Tax=Streptomyces meridianus TaxID=2938945 RepID=A0ABT0X2W3_9ACTN|nr:HAD family hydrolase [Streptomyces meridianus]MCM2576882.1 HAD family hydrolase [Streptomyces meridianus]
MTTSHPVLGPEGPIRPTAASPDPAPIRAVLFDFSGTLLQIRSYAERIHAVLGEQTADAEVDRLLVGLEAGLADPEVIRAQQGRDVSARAHRHAFTTWYASVPALAPHADALYDQLRTPHHWMPYADTEETLGRLAHEGVAIGVVSDIGWQLPPTFAHHGLDRHVSAWVHSYEHGTEKPDPLLFDLACGKLCAAPQETLMVGDNPYKDGGAAGAGLRSYVLPAGATPGCRRGLDAVLSLVRDSRRESRPSR